MNKIFPNNNNRWFGGGGIYMCAHTRYNTLMCEHDTIIKHQTWLDA